jgi:hypothetical protein
MNEKEPRLGQVADFVPSMAAEEWTKVSVRDVNYNTNNI